MASEILKQGDQRRIIATVPSGQAFTQWTGDTQYLANPLAADTIVTMPTANVNVTANFVFSYNCIKYGFLYNWYAANDARNIANTGWSLPSNSQYATLRTYLGGDLIAGGKLKVSSPTIYWSLPNTGATNEVGFNGIGAGYRQSGTPYFQSIQRSCFLWTSTIYSSSNGYNVDFQYDNSVFGNTNNSKINGFSIRLIKDSTTLSHGQSGIYIGNDGKSYRTICIGTQEWLADNLAETRFRDGSNIPVVTDNTAWAALTTAGMCAYNNDWSNAVCSDTLFYPKYGLLYNWYAVSNIKNIAPVGWHVATQSDWNILVSTMGGSSVAGKKMKSTSWGNGTDEYGFNAVPSGNSNCGTFVQIGINAWYWHTAQTSLDTTKGEYSVLINDVDSMTDYSQDDGKFKCVGMSVRLIKDDSNLENCVGNDGKVYESVKIGNQVWIKENLAETKYRDGSLIPEITNSTQWLNDTTGALCAYNNDWNNV